MYNLRRCSSPEKYLWGIGAMNDIIHLKKVENLNNKKSVLKLRKTRNVTSAQLLSNAIRTFLSVLLKCPYITMFLMFQDPKPENKMEFESSL